jgi:hypothetical protein
MREYLVWRHALKRLTIATLFLSVMAIGTAGFFYGRRVAAASGARPEDAQELFALLPKQAPFVMYADIAQLRNSPFFSTYADAIKDNAQDWDYKMFVQATGFDYTKDLDRVAVAVFPTNAHPELWIVAEGRFDREKISSYSAKQGSKTQRNGATVYVIPGSGSDTEDAVSFLDPNRIQLITGPRSAVEAPRDSLTMGAADFTSHAGNAVFFGAAGTDGLMFFTKDSNANSGPAAQAMDVIREFQWLSISGTMEGENLRVALEGNCDTPEHAAQIQFVLQAMRLYATSQAAQNSIQKQLPPAAARAAGELLDKSEVKQSNQSIMLSFLLTPEIMRGLSTISPPKQQAVTDAAPKAKAAVAQH